MPRSTSTPALIAAAAAMFSLSAVVATGAQAASKPPATAKTVTACVNKKSGATKVLLGSKAKKKCPKGSTKVRWSVSGKNGANGVSGTNGTNGKDTSALQVRDSAGNVLGRFAGTTLFSAVPIYNVLASDGGLYMYLPSGELEPSLAAGAGGIVFADSGCAGTAYANVSAPPSSSLSLFVGPARLVYRSGNLGAESPARVWKYTSTTLTVPSPAPTYYQLDPTGACVAIVAGPNPLILPLIAGNALIALESTPAPPDGVGPLTIG
jgi:uncharacterized low-complexity protein